MSGYRAGRVRPALRMVAHEPDQVPRLLRFREQHPDVIIGASEFGTWQARTPRRTGRASSPGGAARPAIDRAGAASIAAAHSAAACLHDSAGLLLTHAANTAYLHGMAHAASVCIGLLVICAILCLILLPGKPAKATAPETDPGIR